MSRGVEVAGFEPAAFWSRTKRATKLRYTSMLEPMRWSREFIYPSSRMTSS